MAEIGRVQWLAYLAAAAVLLVAAVRVLDGGSGDPAGGQPAVALDGAPPASGGAAAGGAAPGAGKLLYVHVAGAVRRPGLHQVPAGSRVAAAIDRAGGPSRRGDLTAVNLAALLEDGQQVIVPVRGVSGASGPAPAATAGGAGASQPGTGGAGAAPLSLSSATVEQLDALDGIGPKLAARIVQYREEHGGFRSVEELQEVDGIGEKRFEALREAVRP